MKGTVLDPRHHLEAAIFTFGSVFSFLFHFYVTGFGKMFDWYGGGVFRLVFLTYFISYCCSFLPKYRPIALEFIYVSLVYFVSLSTHLIIGYIANSYAFSGDIFSSIHGGVYLLFGPTLPVVMVFLVPMLLVITTLYHYMISKKSL